MKYDCIIIGAGVGGLTAALKLSQSGMKVLIIEKQPIPGGFATMFTRKGFCFESSIHCVDALGKDGDIRNFLEEHGIDKKIDFIELKEFARIIYPEHDFVADFRADHFIEYLKNNFPDESRNIDRLFNRIEKFNKQFDRYCKSKLPSWLTFLLSPLLYPEIIKASIPTTNQFIAKYTKNKKIECIISDIWRFIGLPPERLCAFYFLILFKGYFCNPTCYIRGGFQELFNAIARQIKENGSEVMFNTTVQKIVTYKNSVKSVITNKKEEFAAAAIISNADAIDTLTFLLDNDTIKNVYNKKLASLEKSVSAFQVYLGLKIPAKNLGMNHARFSINPSYNHVENFDYCLKGDYERCLLEITDHAQIDPTLVPEGKGSLLIMTYDNYANWKDLNKEEYKLRKQRVTEKLIERAQNYLPGLKAQIEIIEAASPLTMERYGSSPEGAIYGFAQIAKQASINRLKQKTLIKGLFLSGAWTFPGGGVHGCFVSGIEAAKLTLKFLR